MDNVSDWIFPSDETIPVAVVGGLLAVFLFLSFDIRRMLTSSESKQRPEDNPGPEADQRDSTRTKAAQQAAAKAKASEERAARQQEAAQKAAAQKVVADKIATEMAAQEAARAAAAAAAAAATPAPAKLALDTSNDGVLSALMCGGFDDALVSDVEGRQIHCNDTLQSVSRVFLCVLHLLALRLTSVTFYKPYFVWPSTARRPKLRFDRCEARYLSNAPSFSQQTAVGDTGWSRLRAARRA
jgi:hypothetical protein